MNTQPRLVSGSPLVLLIAGRVPHCNLVGAVGDDARGTPPPSLVVECKNDRLLLFSSLTKSKNRKIENRNNRQVENWS
jgi:hypothetical protein